MNSLSTPEVFILTYKAEIDLHKMLTSLESCKDEFSWVTVIDNDNIDTSKLRKYGYEIRYKKNPDNFDLWGSMDVAISMATEEFFVLYHDDDLAMAGALTSQRDFLVKHPTVAMVATDIEVFDEKNEILEEDFELKGEFEIYPQKTLLRKFMLDDFYLPLPTLMYRRTQIQESGLSLREMFVGNLTDIFLWVWMNRHFELAFLNKKLYRYFKKHNHGEVFSYPSIGPFYIQQYQLLYRMEEYINFTRKELRARKSRMKYLAKKNFSLITENPQLWEGFSETILKNKDILKISGTHRFLAYFKRIPKILISSYRLMKKIKQMIKRA